MKTLRVQSRVASFVISMLLVLQIAPALAEQHGHADVIFTKWVTGLTPCPSSLLPSILPSGLCLSMEGVVSGDVGGGLFAGVASLVSSDPDTGVLDALYQIGTGSAHEFTAHNRVTQDNTTNTAKIKGVVIDGWLKGAKVDGQYQVISPCGILNVNVLLTGDTCFQGTLHVHGGGHSGH